MSEIVESLSLFFGPDDVFEVRALDVGQPGRKAAGWFTGANIDRAAAKIAEIADTAGGIYFTPNPTTRTVYKRAANCLRPVVRNKSTEQVSPQLTHDDDITERRWLIIDVDPVRPDACKKHSATDAEKQAAAAVVSAVRAAIAGVAANATPVEIDSGNGFHLYYRLSQPLPGGHAGESDSLRSTLRCLAAKCDTAGAVVDTSVFNSARIMKVPGTPSRKGVASEDRPHRISCVVSPGRGEVELADVLAGLDPTGELRKFRHHVATVSPSPSADAGALRAARGRAYLAACPGAVSGSGGHNRTFPYVQALIHGFGFSDDEALPLINEWNAKCDPPWSEKELLHKVSQAKLHPNDKPRGWLNAEWSRRDTTPIAVVPVAASPAAVGHLPQVTVTADGINEADDDPHRLGRLVLVPYQNRGRLTLYNLNDEFIHWNGRAYSPIKAAFFRSRTNAAIRKELEASHRQRLKEFDPESGKLPMIPKVSESLVTNVIAAISSQCAIDVSEWPTWIAGETGPDPRDLVAAGNGLIHLPAYAAGADGAVIENTPHYLNFNAVTFAADAAAPEPVEWLRFLRTLWPDDAESICLLQEWFGYLLTPDTRQQKMLLMVGPPRSGKGTISRVLQELVGVENCCNPTLGVLGTPFGLSSLVGKSVAVVEDARLSHRSDAGVVTERLLTISGEGRIDVDRKHRDIISGRLNTRFVVATNELPNLTDASGALARRWCVLKLTESFLGREDKTLAAKLNAELSGIFNWAVAGWKRLRDQGRFTVPQSVADLVDDLCAVSSPVAEFVRDRCWIGDQTYQVDPEELYKEWKQWCEASGRKEPGTINQFGVRLRSVVPKLTKPRLKMEDGSRVHVYRGLRLKAWDEVRQKDSSPIWVMTGHDDSPLHAKEEENPVSRLQDAMASHDDRHDPNRGITEGEL